MKCSRLSMSGLLLSLRGWFQPSKNGPSIRPELEKIEKEYLALYLISGSFEDVVEGRINKKRRRISEILMAITLVMLLRFLCFLTLNENRLVIKLLGNVFAPLGIQAMTTEFILSCSYFGSFLVLYIPYRGEKKHKLQIIVDFSKLMSGHKLSLNSKNYKAFKVSVRRTFLLYQATRHFVATGSLAFTAGQIYLASVIYSSRPSSDLWLNLFYLSLNILWSCASGFWIAYNLTFVGMQVYCLIYLSTVYLRMRFEQINADVDSYARIRNAVKLPEEQIHQLMTTYMEVATLVQKHGYSTNDILGALYILGIPCSVAASMTLIFYPFGHFFANLVMGLICVYAIFMTYSVASLASRLQGTAIQPYNNLHSLLSCPSLSCSLALRYKIMSITKMMASSRPVAFYCYDLFPYTPASFTELLFSSISLLFLFLDIFTKTIRT